MGSYPVAQDVPADASLMDLFSQLLAEARVSKQWQKILLAQTEEEPLTVARHHGSFAFFEAHEHEDIQRQLEGWQGQVAIAVDEWISSHQPLFAQLERQAASIDQHGVVRFSTTSQIPQQTAWPARRAPVGRWRTND